MSQHGSCMLLVKRRHSFPTPDSLSLISSVPALPSQCQRSHRRGLVRERNRFWNHAVLSVITVAFQTVVAVLVILIVSMIWASLFMEFSSTTTPFVTPFERRPPCLDALAAWNEVSQSILLALGYRLLTPIEIKEAINNRFSARLLHIKQLELMPQGAYDPNQVVPMVLYLNRLDDHDGFHANVAGPLPFIKLATTPCVICSHGMFVNFTAVLKLNQTFTSQIEINTVPIVKRLNPPRFSVFDLVMLVVGAVIAWTPNNDKPLVPLPTPAEHSLTRFERMIAILKDWRWETTGWTGQLDAGPPETAHHVHADDAPVMLPHFRRPIVAPDQLKWLSADCQRASLDLWTLFFQRLLYTFMMGPEMQDRFKALISRIVKNISGPFEIRLRHLDLGLATWRSCPRLHMLAQLPQPYTYRLMLDIDLPLFQLGLALDGSAHSSSIAFRVGGLRIRGPVVFGIEHPLARDLSKSPPKHFISFTYERMPDIDFDAYLEADASQLFGLSISNLSPTLRNLFNVYLLKPFVSRFTKLFLMGCLVAPMTIYIPWLDDPSDIRFNSNHAQRIFRWIRRLFATMRYQADDVI